MKHRLHVRPDGAPYVTIASPRPRVRVISLNHPERLNAMSFALVESLYAALATVGADNECAVAILTGAGRGFCSGLDLTDVGMPPGSEGLPISRIAIRAMAFMSNVVPAMRAIPQPPPSPRSTVHHTVARSVAQSQILPSGYSLAAD